MKTIALPFRGSLSRVRRPWLLAIVLLALSVSGGCSLLTPRSATEEMDRAANAPTYKVIFANNLGGDPEIFTGRLTRPITVHEALVESGATQRYRSMLVDLARAVPEQNQVLKLPITWDTETDHVLEEQNYAVHPGDEILVRRDNAGPFDAIFPSLGSHK